LSTSKVSDTTFDLTANKQIILRSITFEKGFHFFNTNMDYTGITATSLCEFEEKLKIISVQSVEYHFHRQDFRKWINNIIGDDELATRITRLDTHLASEELRKELLKILQQRLREVATLYGAVI
jgi:hypothetical protein